MPKFSNTSQRSIDHLSRFLHENNKSIVMKNWMLFSQLSCCLSIIIIVTAFSSCTKEKYSTTIVRGKVYNAITNEPIYEASINIHATWQGKDGADLGEWFFGKTDQQGEFNIKFSPIEGAGLLMAIYKAGFTTEPFFYPENGDDNYFRVQMFALDGHLRLKMVNESGIHDSLYVNLVSPTIRVISNGWGYVSHPQKYPLVLDKDSSWTQIFSRPSEEHIYLSWGFSKDSLPFEDSVFLAKGDTVDYTISF